MAKVVDINNVIREYGQTRNRLILLDYDGTLVPFDQDHRITNPGKKVVDLLHAFVADIRNSVLLISGRDKEYLEHHFNGVPITLVAEHGGYYKNASGGWNTMFISSMGWVPRALAALQALAFQYEGSTVEQKTFSLAWHYRKIAEKISESDKRHILAALRSLPEHEHFLIYDSEFTVELRTPGIDKGAFISRWMGRRYFDLIMSIGDSQTDEDVFSILGDDAYTIKVGKPTTSLANFYLESQEEVLPFLSMLLEGKNGMSHANNFNELKEIGKSID